MRESSERCSWTRSRWRERLFCLRAEDVRVASESRRREREEMMFSRWAFAFHHQPTSSVNVFMALTGSCAPFLGVLGFATPPSVLLH